MTAQTTPDSANRSHPYSAARGGDNGGAQREDSPELLRWRADILMDEMMLGAVDVTAGQATGRPYGDASAPTSTTASATWPSSSYSASPETPPSTPAAPDSSATDASPPAAGSPAPEQNAVGDDYSNPPLLFKSGFHHMTDKGPIALAFGWYPSPEAVVLVACGVFSSPLVQREGWIGHHAVEFH